jgi:sortase A
MRWLITDDERAEYERQLAIEAGGIMGYVSLPKLHIKCPIYHGTDELVLQSAVGHLEASSLPVGGETTHTLISGHRGLPFARLFTDLDRVREGDTWTITVLNETLTYECDRISIVEPEDVSLLKLEEGKDLCTLITCTPYGINTHRLLVRGHRIENAPGKVHVTADAVQIDNRQVAIAIAIPLMLIAIFVMIHGSALKKKRRLRKKKRAGRQTGKTTERTTAKETDDIDDTEDTEDPGDHSDCEG